jgi:hypothetical protein
VIKLRHILYANAELFEDIRTDVADYLFENHVSVEVTFKTSSNLVCIAFFSNSDFTNFVEYFEGRL